ncbi:MAG: hypothetical protein GXO76_06230 [Calditrichaeota bacterium]|nr:hypothetical protein [Calditrichota bacterium]
MPRGRGFGFGGMGYGFGRGRGWGNPTPYCRAYPWLPRGWWAYPQYNQWSSNQWSSGAPIPPYGWQAGGWGAPISWQNRTP